MRNTSQRRRSEVRSGQAAWREGEGDYQHIKTGPLADPAGPQCPECKVRLRPTAGGELRKHARYGWAVTEKRVPCRGWVAQAGSTPPGELPVYTFSTALAMGLITPQLIKAEYGLTDGKFKKLTELPGWPEKAGRVEDRPGRPWLYSEAGVRAIAESRRGLAIRA